MQQFTSLGRALDFHYPTNRAIILLVLTVVGAAMLAGVPGGTAFQAGLAVFFAWALARELDPDHELAALLAAGLSLVALSWAGVPTGGGLFWLLLVVRLLNRTTGLRATRADSLLVAGLGLSRLDNWGYGILTLAAFLADSRLSPPHPRQAAFAGLSALAMVLLALGPGYTLPTASSQEAGMFALGLGLLLGPVFLEARKLRSVTDYTDETLDSRRVRAGQGLAVLAGLQVALWQGLPGLLSMLPLWTAVVGAILFGALKVLAGRLPSGNQGSAVECDSVRNDGLLAPELSEPRRTLVGRRGAWIGRPG